MADPQWRSLQIPRSLESVHVWGSDYYSTAVNHWAVTDFTFRVAKLKWQWFIGHLTWPKKKIWLIDIIQQCGCAGPGGSILVSCSVWFSLFYLLHTSVLSIQSEATSSLSTCIMLAPDLCHITLAHDFIRKPTTWQVRICTAWLFDMLLNSNGLQPVWPLTPDTNKAFSSALDIFSFFGRVLCAYKFWRISSHLQDSHTCSPSETTSTFNTIKVLQSLSSPVWHSHRT